MKMTDGQELDSHSFQRLGRNIELNSFPKVRIDLAAQLVVIVLVNYTLNVYLQVLNESVIKALKFTSIEETARFIKLMDGTFNYLNVHNFSMVSCS